MSSFCSKTQKLHYLNGHGRVRNQMQKRVSQQTSGRKRQQHFQQRLLFFRVVQRHEEEYEERRGAYEQSGTHRMQPQVLNAEDALRFLVCVGFLGIFEGIGLFRVEFLVGCLGILETWRFIVRMIVIVIMVLIMIVVMVMIVGMTGECEVKHDYSRQKDIAAVEPHFHSRFAVG